MTSLESPRVLVIDDDTAFASLLKTILTSHFSARVTTAENCAAARSAFRTSDFDIITVDYELPDGSGTDLIEEIASMPDHPPAVMITGKGGEQAAARAFQVGASGYVVKDQKLRTMVISSVQAALEWSQAERALESERRQLIAIFDSMDQVVYVSDPDTFEVLYANEAARSQWGEMVGHKCYEALQNLTEPCSFCTNKIIFDPDRIGEAYYWQFKNMVNHRWYQLVDKVIRWPDGRDARLEIATDITALKEAEENLRDLNAELKAFAHVVSHDLKSPLASIGTVASSIPMVLEGAEIPDHTSSQLTELLAAIEKNIERAGRLIESLLALAEAGQIPREKCSVDINAVVAEVLEEKEAQEASAGVSFLVADDLGHLYGDPTHVYQVFSNLVGNALAHCTCEEPRIEIARIEDDGAHHFLVRDNGQGIPSEDLERIFLPFFTTRTGHGGIGLSTVKRILDVYDGSITAYNDGGACFEFTMKDLQGLD